MIVPLLLCCLAPPALVAQSEPEKLIEQGHWKRARAIVEPWIRSKSEDPLANFLLSQIRNAFGHNDAPLPLAEKAVRLDGRTPKYHRQLAEVIGVTAQYSGMLRQLFLARRFRKEIDIALAGDPSDIQTQRDLMQFYLLAPGIAGGHKEEARAVADRIARIDVVAGCLSKARLSGFQKDPAKQEAFLRRAIGERPENYRARIVLASYYLAANHHDNDLAKEHAQAALKLDRTRVDAYAVLAAVNAAAGNFAEMEAILTSGEKEVPDDLTPYYRAAEGLIAAHRDLPHARRLLRRYLTAEPEGNAPSLVDARRLVATLAAVARE